jgi:anti-anti-sigma factor
MSQDKLFQVQIIGFPLQLWSRAASHQEDIKREFDIIRAGELEDSVPNRLHLLLQQLGGQYASEETWQEIRRLAARGDELCDVTFSVPFGAAEAARQLASILNEVDEYCRSGLNLISLATPADLVAFREWFLEEFPNQIENGKPPVAWHQAAQPTELRQPPATTSRPFATVRFAGPLDLNTAGRLRDAIQLERAKSQGDLVLDLEEVDFVDSVGIGLLMATYKRLAAEDGHMRLIASSRLQDLLKWSGLTDILRPESP